MSASYRNNSGQFDTQPYQDQGLFDHLDVDSYEFGWIVGILDGEGSFHAGITRRPEKDYYYPAVRVQMNDLDTLEQLQEYVGDGILTKHRDAGISKEGYNRQKSWHWRLRRKNAARELMLLVQPYMSQRRQEQISDVLEQL